MNAWICALRMVVDFVLLGGFPSQQTTIRVTIISRHPLTQKERAMGKRVEQEAVWCDGRRDDQLVRERGSGWARGSQGWLGGRPGRERWKKDKSVGVGGPEGGGRSCLWQRRFLFLFGGGAVIPPTRCFGILERDRLDEKIRPGDQTLPPPPPSHLPHTLPPRPSPHSPPPPPTFPPLGGGGAGRKCGGEECTGMGC